jgi:hypothetical protein
LPFVAKKKKEKKRKRHFLFWYSGFKMIELYELIRYHLDPWINCALHAKNPSHNQKVHLFLSPTVQSCIEIRASTLIYWLLADRPTHMCCGTNLEAATTAR